MTKLYIDDNNIDVINNCDYLSITKLSVLAPKNINLLLDKLNKFINLKILYLYDNQIIEIKGLTKLTDLEELKLINNQITEIKEFNNLINLKILYLNNNKIIEIKELNILSCLQTLYLGYNQITEIKGVNKLVNLQKLELNNNKITEIKELDKLVNLQVLNLSNNLITEIKGLTKLTDLQVLNLTNNQITEIKGLENLVNLQFLNLSRNQIIEIKGLDNLVNLKILDLTKNKITNINNIDNLINLRYLNLSNNQIIEINGLDNLVNLKILDLENNQLTEMTGLNNLINIQRLNLGDNQITEIKNLNKLEGLKELYLHYNQIIEIPLSLCNLRNINIISYTHNPIEYIPLPVERWLDRLNRKITVNNMVYNDKQNIHNHHIQNSFRTSLSNIFKDKQLLDLQTIKQQILENNVLLEQTKREILNYCDDDTMHTSYLITYSDLLIYVWSRIIASVNADEILTVLNQEINDGICMCFTGRLTRLLNTLVGFYDDIELQISDSEQITNIIMALKNKFHGDQLMEAVRKELLDRQYSESIINEWLDYI